MYVLEVGITGTHRAESACGATVCVWHDALCHGRFVVRAELLPVHSDHQQAGNKGPEDLAEDVVRHLFPREALPDCEADRYGWVEVSAASRSASDDCESNTDAKAPSDLEQRAESGHPELTRVVDCERGNRRDAWEDVEENAGSFGDAFSKPAGPSTFKVKLALRYRLGRDDSACNVPLSSFCCSELEVVSL